MSSQRREAIGYDHGYDSEVFYLDLALDPAYVEGFVEGIINLRGRLLSGPILATTALSVIYGEAMRLSCLPRAI